MKLPSFLRKVRLLILLTPIFSLLLLGTSSCKSKDQKKEPGDKDTTAVGKQDSTEVELKDTTQMIFFKPENKINAMDDDDDIYNLTLEPATLDDIFKKRWRLGPVVSLRFDFYKLNGKRALHVCGVNDNDTRCTDYFDLSITGTGEQSQGNLHRVQHYVTRGQIRQFLGMAPATGPLPVTTRFINMYFKANPAEDPRWPGDELLFFNIDDDRDFKCSTGPIKKLDTGEGITNPSPPFTAPCADNCDGETRLRFDKK